jgi:hypothetical protein
MMFCRRQGSRYFLSTSAIPRDALTRVDICAVRQMNVMR